MSNSLKTPFNPLNATAAQRRDVNRILSLAFTDAGRSMTLFAFAVSLRMSKARLISLLEGLRAFPVGVGQPLGGIMFKPSGRHAVRVFSHLPLNTDPRPCVRPMPAAPVRKLGAKGLKRLFRDVCLAHCD